MLIKTLDLRNFQAHKILSLKFSRGLNVIKGTSGVGKSAILRAIFQLIDESIPWSVCQTWNTDDTSIKLNGLVLGERCCIERIHSSKQNSVIIDGKEYDYVGKNAPELLQQKLNIKEQNIQKQKNHWFLIDLKPSQLSKELNSVSGLNIIDASIHEIASRVRNAQTELRLLTGQAAVLEKEVHSLQYIEQMHIMYKSVEEAEHTLTCVEDIQNALKYLNHQLKQYLAQKKNILPEGIEEDLQNLKVSYQKYTTARKEYLLCSEYYEKMSTLSSSLRTLTQNHSTVESEFNELAASFRTYASSSQKVKNLSAVLKQLQSFYQYKKEAKAALEEAMKEQSKIKICPTCGRPI